MQNTLTILGAGSSAGTPVVGCKCETCLSGNPRNTRTRCSSLVTLKNGKNILIDTSPDLREQSLRESITKIDAVLFTHAHADHCHGIDDLRAFCQINKIQIPLYGNKDVIDQLTNKFKYAMIEPKNFWEIPVLKPNIVNAPFEIFDEIITPIPVMHGNNSINGYRIGNLGYITDASEISENSMKLLEGVDALLLDCLRMEPHFTHLSFSESIEIAKKIKAKKTYLIHMTHSLGYESLRKMLPEGVYVGYDGLKLQIN
jgi:phosphoribosyl 1,2-cyclic phosphate phosphodiesterase